MVVDCANGAAFQVAPRVLEELGAEVIPIFHMPDGVNINAGCGSTHPEALMEEVLKQGADLGLAHDGDADRVLAVDSQGQLVMETGLWLSAPNTLRQRAGCGKIPW
ncbi:hypothetical protein N752_10730 [Desulforamulus aquiferis]|nr:hypothetical protein N752_10730 [Desulforamulus aquiferis]